MRSGYLTILLVFVFYCKSIGAADKQAFGLEEKGGTFLPDSIMVLNEDSVPVILNDLIVKPTLLSFVYYHCPSLCPKMMEGIAELVNYTEIIPEKDYQVVTLSIDHKETTQDAREAKRKYTGMINKHSSSYFWRFFTADSNTIRKLTDAVGWDFREVEGNFLHTTSTVLITPEKKVSQYFYGTYFNYMHFAMSVRMAANEEVVPTRLKTLKYCYNYRPAKNGKVVWTTTIYGLLTLVLSVGLFIMLSYTSGRGTSSN